MPREKDGKTLRPRIGIVARESSPEWVNEDENGQLRSLELMKSKGIKADTWWIDAGWFLKRNTPSWWFVSQWWHADKEKYPHSMRHFSEILNKENIELLLWHEPERMCISEKYPLPDGLKKEWIIPTEKASADKSVEAAYFAHDKRQSMRLALQACRFFDKGKRRLDLPRGLQRKHENAFGTFSTKKTDDADLRKTFTFKTE